MSLRSRWKSGDRFLVRYKDEDVVVVDKSAPLLTVPKEHGEEPSLLRLLGRFLDRGRRAPLFPVHRLDRPVSGLLVFARNRDAREGLVEQFAAHDVERRYVAAVQGLVERDEGTFESYLASEGRTLRMRSTSAREGRRAVTHYSVLERLERARVTLVEVELETGLRNQIRVHFAEAGHPLLGERKYDGTDEGGAIQGRQRIFLHARVLGFHHPIRGHFARFESDLPPDLRRWRAALEERGGRRR